MKFTVCCGCTGGFPLDHEGEALEGAAKASQLPRIDFQIKGSGVRAAETLAIMASCSATPAGPGTIKNGPVPAEDAATYQYLGYTVPRQNIDDKFGSYWGTALGLATGPASIAATTILLCALSGWQPVILGSGGAFCFFISSLCILDAPTKVTKIKDRPAVCCLL